MKSGPGAFAPSGKNVEVNGAAAAPSAPPDKIRTWFDAAAVVLLKGILLLFVLNLVIYGIIVAVRPAKRLTPFDWYGRDRIMKAYPGWRDEDVKTLLSETWREVDAKYEYEPFTGFKLRPFRGKFVNIDPAGFRISKEQPAWPPRPEAFNVFVFGGSTAFGIGLPDDQTISSYLQECSPENHSSKRLAVYNFGRSGYFSSQELVLFQQLLNAGLVPRVAVFIDGVNDFWQADGQPSFTDRLRRFMDGKPESTLLDNLPMIQAAHWMRQRWAKPQSQQAANPADNVVLEGVVRRWLANKKMIEVIGAGFGVRTIFVWQPIAIYNYDLRYHFLSPDRGFGQGGRIKRGYALMENLRAQGTLGSDVLWLADMQQDKHENLYVDQWHYTATFSKEIAGRICSALTK